MILHDRLFTCEIGESQRCSSVRSLYGNRTWIERLDIVHQLEGHTGCVNALSWAKSGRLLASGSDDQHVNIHSYQADDSPSPFKLTTSIATGHRANIFSVKFMPHSGDRTIISAAGDAEIRIFDLEYSGRLGDMIGGPSMSTAGRARGMQENGVRYHGERDTNARVYRSHSDRVKRIVTESSPHLFLSCSEDGEVRQWDLRQPSSAYPRPRAARSWSHSASDAGSDVPPALISYKRWRIDLNSISCSPSQPHYILLGGAHLHAFLHDRRMLGRDKASEAGSPGHVLQDDAMGEATRCVRRFAPDGQRSAKTSQNGHITACKISDANPNEMIASWSGDWIYSFDLIRSPDALHEGGTDQNSQSLTGWVHTSSGMKKRKRHTHGSSASREATNRATSAARTATDHNGLASGQVTLRVRYGNGQSEDIAIHEPPSQDRDSSSTQTMLTEAGRKSRRIAQVAVQLRKSLFQLERAGARTEDDITGHGQVFRAVFRMAATVLPEIDDMIRTWTYPVNPDPADVVVQTTIRRARESTRRFIQAAGTIGRLLASRTPNEAPNFPAALHLFTVISPAPNELDIIVPGERFSYDFLKAILLWLDSGPGAVLEAFSKQGRHRSSNRFPIHENASIEAIDEILIPYLLALAAEQRIPNVDASRFEIDENRSVFVTEREAVMAFANALRIPFADLSQPSSSTCDITQTQDRETAIRFWGFGVARGLLMNAGRFYDYVCIDRAFGGRGDRPAHIRAMETSLNMSLQNVDLDEDDPEVEAVAVTRHLDNNEDIDMLVTNDVVGYAEDEQDGISEEGAQDDAASDTVSDNDEDEEEHINDEEEEEEEEEDDQDSEDSASPRHNLIWRAAHDRSAARSRIHAHTPCFSHLQSYQGHCNVKTVKDVTFVGQHDEYVASGSDSGHLFLWDRVTGRLVNILEGDGDVVNVVQPHPYEPTLAVSGIDSTIKIFSPDGRARADARRGVNISGSARPNRYARPRHVAATSEPALTPNGRRPGWDNANDANQDDHNDDDDDDDDMEAIPLNRLAGLASARRMHLADAIVAQNDSDRRGGNRDAFLTRSMLAQLAARMRLQRAAASATTTEGPASEGTAHRAMEEDAGLANGPIVVRTDDCAVM